MIELPTLADIETAAERIRPYARRTPVLSSRSLDELASAQLFFKCENFQRCGAFKFRGACNAILSLDEACAVRGVATHSSGNHAAALAHAASLRGMGATVVMPSNANAAKRAAVEHYGGVVHTCGEGLDDRERMLAGIVAKSGATVIHPYNDPRIIAGQGTAAKEMLEHVPGLEIVLCPIGGGGLISGAALAVKSIQPETLVIGAEPAGADDAFRSLEAGRIVTCDKPVTMADGLRANLGDLTFAAIQSHVARIVTVSEASIARAMRLVWERMKILIEPSAAVPVAALLEVPDQFVGQRVGIILSGGNVDLDHLPWSAHDQ